MTNENNFDIVLKVEEGEEVRMNVYQLVDIDEDHIDRGNLDASHSKEIARKDIPGEESIDTSITTRSSKHLYISNKPTQVTSKNNCEQLVYNPSWSTGADVSDVICFGATVLIVLLLLSLLVFYVLKDHEMDIET